MESNTIEFGKTGENQAAEYLKSMGYTIIEQNWRMGKYEIDIIAENDCDILFVEVKTDRGLKFRWTKRCGRNKNSTLSKAPTLISTTPKP
jgi:putative endonuclease